jgi:hypothetical protein
MKGTTPKTHHIVHCGAEFNRGMKIIIVTEYIKESYLPHLF